MKHILRKCEVIPSPSCPRAPWRHGPSPHGPRAQPGGEHGIRVGTPWAATAPPHSQTSQEVPGCVTWPRCTGTLTIGLWFASGEPAGLGETRRERPFLASSPIRHAALQPGAALFFVGTGHVSSSTRKMEGEQAGGLPPFTIRRTASRYLCLTKGTLEHVPGILTSEAI